MMRLLTIHQMLSNGTFPSMYCPIVPHHSFGLQQWLQTQPQIDARFEGGTRLRTSEADRFQGQTRSLPVEEKTCFTIQAADLVQEDESCII